MATFGYTSIGASLISGTADNVQTTQLVTLSEPGVIEKVSVYTNADAGAPTKARGVIYASDNTLVAYGSEVTITEVSAAPAWKDSFFSGLILQPGDYYIGFGYDATFFPGTTWYYYDTVASANRGSEVFTYSAFPTTLTPIASTRQLSAYATYTPVPKSAWLTG